MSWSDWEKRLVALLEERLSLGEANEVLNTVMDSVHMYSPIDVWLRFADDDDEYAEAEANTFKTELGFRVDWYLNAVGLVKSVEFTYYDEAVSWLESQGFQDFSS